MSEHPPLSLPGRAARMSFALGDLRREWAGRDVELTPRGQGPEAWLLVDIEGERAWLPVGLRTLGKLVGTVGGDAGRIQGGAAIALSRPLPLAMLAELEPDTWQSLSELSLGLEYGEDVRLGGLFSGIGQALKKVVNKARSIAKKAAEAASKAASAVAKAASSAAHAAGKAIEAAKKPLLAGGLIIGGVALGIATGGAALPAAGALVGAGIGAATSGKGGGLGKPMELFTHMGIGAAAGLAVGAAASWVVKGGLTQVGSSLFSSSTGTQVGAAGAATAETTQAAGAAGFSWTSLPIGGIIKTTAGFVLKGTGGAAQPVNFAPGMAPTDLGMTAYPTTEAAPPAAPAAGMDVTTLAIAGIGMAAILVLGLRR